MKQSLLLPLPPHTHSAFLSAIQKFYQVPSLSQLAMISSFCLLLLLLLWRGQRETDDSYFTSPTNSPKTKVMVTLLFYYPAVRCTHPSYHWDTAKKTAQVCTTASTGMLGVSSGAPQHHLQKSTSFRKKLCTPLATQQFPSSSLQCKPDCQKHKLRVAVRRILSCIRFS